MLNIVYFLYYYFKLQRLGFILLLAVNRGTAILLPFKYRMFWVKYNLRLIIIVFIFPISTTWMYFISDVRYKENYSVNFTYTMNPGIPEGIVSFKTIWFLTEEI